MSDGITPAIDFRPSNRKVTSSMNTESSVFGLQKSFTSADVFNACEASRDMSIAKQQLPNVRELPAGTIVKIAGIPLKAVFPITLETSSGNWQAIKEWQDGPHQGEQEPTLPPSN